MLVVRRLISDEKSTVGMLELGGQFLCFTLEDGHRDIKVRNETRIPAGRYEVKLRTAGGMHPRYAKRYSFHKGMLHLQNVPGFEWIYIHVGNTANHTSGCILVGMGAEISPGRMSVARSSDAYKKVYPIIHDLMVENGGVTTIGVYDFD